MKSVKPTPDIVITKEDAKNGMTILVEKGQCIRIKDWKNKEDTDILFIAPIKGMYKIHGDIL